MKEKNGKRNRETENVKRCMTSLGGGGGCGREGKVGRGKKNFGSGQGGGGGGVFSRWGVGPPPDAPCLSFKLEGGGSGGQQPPRKENI